MKTYTTKANAKRAAKSQNIDLDTIEIIEVDGKFGWEEKISAEDQELLATVGYTHCKMCGTHFSNGLMHHTQQVDPKTNPDAEPFTKEWFCMACGEEFGEDLVLTRNKSVIENPCTYVWTLAENMSANGCKRKEILAAAVQDGVAYYTARTQYQLWKQATKA